MKVSIIIRTFNRPLLLKQALASISLQSHKNWEVIIFDDSNSGKDILNIIQNFRKQNPNNTTLYLNSNTPRYFFKKSWEVAPQIANGEVMVRLDDDDLLAENSLESISKIYTDHPLLDYSYGSCIVFKEDELINRMISQSPLEAPKTKDIWAGYLESHPWREPWRWVENYYNKPRHFTSIIHCSKASIMCSYHTYVIRTSSALSVLNKFNVVSDHVDDLEVMGSLDYLGLRHTSIKSTLSYVREHDSGRVTDNNALIRDELLKTRDKVEYLRHENFTSNVYLENIEGNIQNEEISNNDRSNFKQYYNKVKLKANQL
jgi:glycosyltransferase involved in cell wall biosynthesis